MYINNNRCHFNWLIENTFFQKYIFVYMNIRFLFFTMFALSFILTACSESFTDSRDGQSYDVVKIGNLSWMAENLNYETETSACPDGDSRNCKRMGRLYTWAEAKTVCPEGWRLPTKSDFAQLLTQLNAGVALKSRDGWFKKGNGSDEFGFNALPAGYRGAVLKTDDGTVTSENPESNAYYLFLSFSSDAASINAFAKEDYRSVRCVR